MPSVVLLSASPSPSSKTRRLTQFISDILQTRGYMARHIVLRDLAPQALLSGDSTNQQIAQVCEWVDEAAAVVVATPTFKASYSGLLKTFLDLLPQKGLAGKVVMPIATGGTLAHVLMLDYALRPVLQSMAPAVIVQSTFVLESWFAAHESIFEMTTTAQSLLDASLHEFVRALTALHPPTAST